MEVLNEFYILLFARLPAIRKRVSGINSDLLSQHNQEIKIPISLSQASISYHTNVFTFSLSLGIRRKSGLALGTF
jgi:hypothetical protein